MEIKTSKIEDILNVRPYEGQYGKTFYFELLMANGDRGSIGKKKEDALKIGDELTYSVEVGERGNKFKEIKENGFSSAAGGFKGNGGGYGSKGGNESFALAYSKDLHVAMIAAGITGAATSEQIKASILKTAAEFKDWMDANKS